MAGRMTKNVVVLEKRVLRNLDFVPEKWCRERDSNPHILADSGF